MLPALRAPVPAPSQRAHPSSVLAAGGETGDLYVFVSVRDHPDLRREGVTVHSDVGISYLEAILGEGRCGHGMAFKSWSG